MHTWDFVVSKSDLIFLVISKINIFTQKQKFIYFWWGNGCGGGGYSIQRLYFKSTVHHDPCLSSLNETLELVNKREDTFLFLTASELCMVLNKIVNVTSLHYLNIFHSIT
jgi:hypothetical protein